MVEKIKVAKSAVDTKKPRSRRRVKKSKISKGEKNIAEYLTTMKISFEAEKVFLSCFDKASLRFDFYIPHLNLCIEFDGLQHVRPIKKFGGKKGFDRTVLHDTIKFNFCLKHRISLLRIPFHHRDNIPPFLSHAIAFFTKYPRYFFLIDPQHLPPHYDLKLKIPSFF